jgi:hypothetical protein
MLLRLVSLWRVSVALCLPPNHPEAGKSLAALRDRAMVERFAPIRVIVFLLLAACGALCQTERPSVDLAEGGDSNSQKGTWKSLPDAPSVLLPTKADRFQAFVVEARSRLTPATVGINAVLMRETDPRPVTPRLQPSFGTSYKRVLTGNGSSTFFDRYLYPSVLKQNLRYQPSTGNGLVSRASYAASRIFITRDDSGKGRLNSSYFLGALTSVAIHTAYRPYWARSSSATFNNFGSTIGSDAGFNLFREFGPGIRKLVKGHPAKTGSGIEDRITHDQKPGGVVSGAAR